MRRFRRLIGECIDPAQAVLGALSGQPVHHRAIAVNHDDEIGAGLERLLRGERED